MRGRDVPAAGVFAGGGELGELMQGVDWGQTPLGPVGAWPQSLQTVVRILLTSRYAMWMGWGPELTFLYNDTYARMTLGKKHPWGLGKPASVVWSEIWADLWSRIQGVLQEGRATWDEGLLLFLERSGFKEETYHTFSYSPLSGDDGRITGMLCVVSEETERVIGERRLSFLRTLAAGLGTAIVEEDVLAAIRSSLAQNRKDLPFTLTYLAGADGRMRLRCTSGIVPGHGAAPQEIEVEGKEVWPVGEVLSSKATVTVDELGRRFTGLPMGAWDTEPRRAVLVPLQRQGQEQPAGIFIAGLNPYRPLDSEYTGFLELIAGQMAAGLANAHAYEQERRRAEALAELDRAKTIFFSNVSHEFRTPLTLMLGPLEEILSARDSELPGEERAQVETVHRNGLRLLKLVNALLDFSRIEAGGIQALYRPVDLAARTAELASMFRSAMQRAGLRYEIHCDALPEPLHVDLDMWEKIVLNLLSNAFKFTLQGTVEVSLGAVDGQAELRVRDTGTGIPAAELPRIFERFHRIEGAAGRTHEGTGIGLALVDELVRLHGGSVQAESEVGAGTTFTVRIPFGTEHLPGDRIAAKGPFPDNALGAAPYVQEALRWLPGGAAGEEPLVRDLANEDLGSLLDPREPAEGERARVVLADDNRDMREYVQRLLGRKYQVTAVEDGEAALREAVAHPPDLVLTDVMMPRMNGFELLRALRADPATAATPVMLLSARAGEEAETEGLEAGADDYLVKPFTARELMARVGSHVSMHRLRLELTGREHALRTKAEHAERQYREILESISEGFAFISRDWKIRHANSQVTQLSGLRAESLMGKNLSDVVPGWEKTKFGECLREAMETGEVRSAEEYYEPSKRWIHANAYPSDEGLSVFARDVTERRTQQEKLLLSEKLAATGRLAATIAHEINNPLESVLNLIYLARTTRQEMSKIREYLETAEKELNRVSHIARHTLGFYRETSVASDIDLAALIEEVLTVYESRLRASGIAVSRDFAVVPAIRALRGELHQVFSNLISNAIDAMREGGTLKIGVEEEKRDAGVAVTIEDSGMGIPEENLPRLFEPFFTTKPSAGTGLGLWVVRQFVASWGGRVVVKSDTDSQKHGTTFTIFLPLVAASEPGSQMPRRLM
ncbi:MAG TPA: ATP-binding protein [Acidobacteriaceae bacterium]|jgi:PAS domain S-box-containing protein|nr:ATP-binding protein [Acidobacteriaceae bacterium]